MNDARHARLERWALQAAARELLPDEAVSYCLRRVVPSPLGGKDGVTVWYSEAVHKAHYKNLATCHSVWHCPICAAKITERRRQELTDAITFAPELDVYMVTFTLHHDRRDDLGELLADLLGCFREMKAGRKWVRAEKDLGIVGSVRALEVTHWLNGWHPHLHVLLFVNKGADIGEIESFFKSRWLTLLQSKGRRCDDEHGVNVSGARYTVAEYIAKFGKEPKPNRWAHEHELTKAPVKSGGGEHRTPMQLLRDYLHGDKRAGQLWKEYAMVFKGRHQLQWSRGLRKMLGLGVELTDKELAEATEQDAVLLAQISLAQWRVILANDARGELLEIAHSGDASAVRAFVDSLTGDLSLPARDTRAACDPVTLGALVQLDRVLKDRIRTGKILAEMAT